MNLAQPSIHVENESSLRALISLYEIQVLTTKHNLVDTIVFSIPTIASNIYYGFTTFFKVVSLKC